MNLRLKLLSLVFFGGFIELDKDTVGQWMISRPIVLGPAVGAFFGQTFLGLEIGALYELFGLCELPIGGHMPVDMILACLSCLILILGPGAAPISVSFPLGLLWGWFARTWENKWRFQLSSWEDFILLNREKKQEFSSLFYRRAFAFALKQTGSTWVFLALALFLRMGGAHLWSHLDLLRQGFDVAFRFAPWVAVASLWKSFRRA